MNSTHSHLETKFSSERGHSNGLYSNIPLNGDSKRLIRLLRLAPGNFEDEIRGTLKVVDLARRPKYATLSYTWGVAKEGRAIRLHNDYKLSITDNLFRALRRLRRRGITRTVWVDAICVNQSDNEERAQQVRIMREIYSQAQCVNVWFGEYENPQLSDKYLPLLPYAFARHRPNRISRALHYPRRSTRRLLAALGSAVSNSSPHWYDRAWVTQEFILSHKVYAFFGPVRVRLRAHKNDYSFDLFTADGDDNFSILLKLCNRFEDLGWSQFRVRKGYEDLITSYLAHGNTSATDPRDKVFSLLGIINPAEAKAITPDYNMPLAEVFARATFASIQTRGIYHDDSWQSLELVSFGQSTVDRLPSWAVDFTKNPHVDRYIPIGNIARSRDPFLEKFALPFNVRFTMSTETKRPQLITNGIAFDTVARILRIDTDEFTRKNDLDEGKKVFGMYALLLIFVRNAARRAISSGHLSSAPYSLVSLGRDDVWYHALLEKTTKLTDGLSCALYMWNFLVGIEHRLRDLGCPQLRKPWPRPTCTASEEVYAEPGERYATLHPFRWYVKRTSDRLNVFETTHGFVGLAPSTVNIGDSIAILPNCRLQVVLRAVGENWMFRGLAWVQGLVHGELLPDLQDMNLEERSFTLV